MNCRFDGLPLTNVFIDLGFAPPSNSYLKKEQLAGPEVHYPLKTWISERTFLAQLDEVKVAREIFNEEYAYFSSYSTTWLIHCEKYCTQVVDRFGLTNKSHVVEIASNDGYLLQYFKRRNIPVLGIEPTRNTADVAKRKGIETIVEFFNVALAEELRTNEKGADLIVGNNVLAHVPDLNDFIKGLKILLNPDGIITLEFPHLMQLIIENQFDTIYHEHYSYFLLYTTQLLFKSHGLQVFDVEQIDTHGGSLRIYVQHEGGGNPLSKNVLKIIEIEKENGMMEMKTYQDFQKRTESIKLDLLSFLIEQRKHGKTVAAYGAAAKGNTLLNFLGVKPDLISFVCDRSPHKQNKFMPGSHIEICPPDEIEKQKPDFILILPWNIKNEIIEQLNYTRNWNTKFVTAIPRLEIC